MSTAASRVGAVTMAALLPAAAAAYGDHPAQRVKRDGAWVDVSFAELGRAVSEIGRGLIGLGLEPGERVAILCATRPEWSAVSFAVATAGLVAVPVYPTNSPQECAWVIGNSEAAAVVCEDAAQLAKLDGLDLPRLRHRIAVDPAGDAMTLDQLRAQGREGDEGELSTRAAAVTAGDPFTFIYTSGTTGPPKGCVLTHGNYTATVGMVSQREVLGQTPDDVVYLFLPLAHSFGLLLQLACAQLGVTIAYWGGDPQRILAELSEVRPTYLPSVPRIFEKLFTAVTARADPQVVSDAVAVGLRVRGLEAAGEPVPEELAAAAARADAALFTHVRAAFGGRLREAVTGAAPIAPEILELFYASGVPVMEGYGMTETATTATTMRPGDHRFGSVGRAHAGTEIAIAGDGEVLIRGPHIFAGYHGNPGATAEAVDADGFLHTGDLGRLDDDGFLFITGRKKDIIITAGGKNLTPANLENDVKASRWVSQAVMHGDRRPYPTMLVTLDEDEVRPWAAEHGVADTSSAGLARDPQVTALIQETLDAANAGYARVEQVKRFFVLEHDLAQETGELTPTLKVKRAVVMEKYAERFDALYADGA